MSFPSRSLALLAGALLTAPAFGQGFNTPYHAPPSVPIPGANLLMPTLGDVAPPNTLLGEVTGGRPYLGTPVIGGLYPVYYSSLSNGYFGGYPYPTYLPYYSGYGYTGYYTSGYTPAQPYTYMTPAAAPTTAMAYAVPAVQGAGGTPSPASVTARLPAELTIDLPAAADVWLNGKKLDGQEKTRTLASPALDPGETYKFDVKARWSAGGENYEWTKTVTLGSGDRSRATVTRGFKVND